MKIAVIGGGIIGLSIGYKFFEHFAGAEVTIFEKDSQPGLHASTRNSGVIHSGLYYSPDSLKSRFSIDGNRQLKSFIRSAKLPLKESGKIIVTKNEAEIPRLEALASRAARNGVEIELLDSERISSIQPGATTIKKFIFSPSTAISDPKLLFHTLLDKYLARGGKISTSSRIEAGTLSDDIFQSFDWVVNCGGGGALKIAQTQGLGLEYDLMPFLGIYWGSKSLSKKLSVPIYPLPHAINPFLGVHLTPTIGELSKIGPTAIPVLGTEQYKINAVPSAQEIFQTLKGAVSMARGEKHSLAKIAFEEFRYLQRRNMIKDASKLFPYASDVSDWRLMPGGIRSQLINNRTGALLDDFLVETKSNQTHILNAVSPGWTSALAFSEWVIETHFKG